jgi:hypothetical protein
MYVDGAEPELHAVTDLREGWLSKIIGEDHALSQTLKAAFAWRSRASCSREPGIDTTAT